MLEYYERDTFEAMLRRIFGTRMQTEDTLCINIWSALSNVDWYNPTLHETASYSFRSAGSLIADIRGSGGYMDWYMSGPDRTITDEIRRSFKKEGWIPDESPDICDVPGCLNYVGAWWNDADGSLRQTCGEHYTGRLSKF